MNFTRFFKTINRVMEQNLKTGNNGLQLTEKDGNGDRGLFNTSNTIGTIIRLP